MSTRGRIGIKQSDGSIKSIYVHFDSYPEGVGATLNKYYTDRKKIEELLDLGDISSLGKSYDEEVSKMDWKRFDEKDPKKRDELIKRAENCTIAYKDRGEDCPARVDADEVEFIEKLGRCCEEYTYLWKEGWDGIERWHIVEASYFIPLEEYSRE